MKNNLLVMRGPVDMVKIAASRVVPGDVDPEQLDHLIRQRDSMASSRRRLLPMEEFSAKGVVEVMYDLENEVKKLERRQKIVEFSRGEYQLQLVDPLKWRQPDTGLPIFGVFHPGVPNFGFIATAGRTNQLFEELLDTRWRQSSGSVRMVPQLPKLIADCYRDVASLVDKRAQARLAASLGVRGIEVRLTAKFAGLLPDFVKEEMIKAVESKLFKSLYVIAEVQEWKWDQAVTSRQGDPILVGFDGEELWRLKVFDTTSAEQLMADEFAVKAV